MPSRRELSLSHVSGDAVGLRDRVAGWALGVGAAVALLAWHALGPWPALVLVILAVVVAAVAYRIEPPTIDLEGRPEPGDAVPEPVGDRAEDQ